MAIFQPNKLDKKKVGRPREYDPHIIAEEILEWSLDEESINIAQFCADRGYLPVLIWRLDRENEKFSHAYMMVKMRLAERRERMLNCNLLNYGAWQRYQRGYDPFLAKEEDEKEDKDAQRKKGIAETEHKNLYMLAKLAGEGKILQQD